jgi:hypothetical protein
MVLAALFHVARGEWMNVPFVLTLGGLAAFVAWGRFIRAPIPHRGTMLAWKTAARVIATSSRELEQARSAPPSSSLKPVEIEGTMLACAAPSTPTVFNALDAIHFGVALENTIVL